MPGDLEGKCFAPHTLRWNWQGKSLPMSEHVTSRLGEMTSVKTKFQYQSLEDFEFQGRSATDDMLHLMILCLNYLVSLILRYGARGP